MSDGASDRLLPAGLATVAVAVGGAAVVSKAIKSSSQRGAALSSVSPSSASRFLTQASFGASDASIAEVQSAGIAGWIGNQLAMPVSGSHLTFVQQRLAALQAVTPGQPLRPREFYESFWQQAVTASDQLRQRVKFALSQIFVISFDNLVIASYTPGVASYYDMLGRNALGNFRTLLEQVTLHPMMGIYLTYLANVPANAATGQHPDENYAREVMQLMTIGLYRLNQDGSVQTDASGNPIPTYSHADIAGLSAVFTGFSWYSANPIATGGRQTFFPPTTMGLSHDPAAPSTPMIPYPTYHQTTAKSFLGVTIPASASPDALGDLKIALDTLFNHSNVGPFIGRQLIQRLVTSNPSPAYVFRVAGVFNDDGAGVRGNLGAVVQAILTDSEARDDTVATSATFGKLREPVIRLANWARGFKAASTSGAWIIPSTSAPPVLQQTVMTAPSVFNFWTPFYSPPGTALNSQGLVSPEFQAVNEVSVAGYLNTMLSVIKAGYGSPPAGSSTPDVQADYSAEIALAASPSDLVARLNLLLMSGQMSTWLQTTIVGSVNSISVPTGAAGPAALKQRAELAIYMTFASLEYLTQR